MSYHKKKDKSLRKMTAKLGKDDLDSLSFSDVKRLLERICKFLGFKLSRKPFYSMLTWLLDVDDDTVVFLDGHNRYEFQTAKELLRGILSSRIFKLRSLETYDDKIVPNPFFSLDISALKIKLDLLA